MIGSAIARLGKSLAHDTGAAARVFLALAFWLEGDPQRANRLIGEATVSQTIWDIFQASSIALVQGLH